MVSCSAAPAGAAVPRIRIPRVNNLPEPRFQVPAPVAIGAREVSEAARYGVADTVVVAELDDAGRALGDDIDQTAAAVRANSEGRLALRQCTGDGLEGAGTSYAEALQEAAATGTATPAPDFDQVISGTSGCLQTYFPDAPAAMFDMGEYLASLAAERARQAYDASQSAAVLATWMSITGAELPTPESDVTSELGSTTPIDTENESDGEGFPLWAAALVLVALFGGAAVARSKRS